jgi:hypothetical protein
MSSWDVSIGTESDVVVAMFKETIRVTVTCSTYDTDQGKKNKRIHLNPRMAPSYRQ